MDSKYYASLETPTEEAAKKVFEIVQNYQRKIYNEQGFSNVWNRNLEIYYRNAYSDVLNSAGVQGELTAMSVPQARSLIRQLVAVVCKQKLKVKAITESSDYVTTIAASIAEAIANQKITEKRLDEKIDLITEQACVIGQAFWHVEWDANGGSKNELTGDYAGDVKISVVPAHYAFYDWNVSDWGDLSSVTIGEKANRYDLLAEHPELEKEIMNLPKFNKSTFGTSNSFYQDNTYETDSINDLVMIYKYYHKPTPAVPTGRMMILASADCVFYDGSNPYECLPVIPVMPEKIKDLLLGYPIFSNLAPLQEMLDHNFSVIASNQTAFGVQSVLNPRTSNISVEMVGGLRWINFTPQNIDGGGKPEALQLTRTAPELINMLDIYTNHMSQISNINSALRGAPPAGVTAASAIATLTANSIEFITPLNKMLYMSVSELLSLIVKYFRMFGAEEQMVQVSDGKMSYAKTFRAADLKSFKRIELDLVNPAMATYAGRQNDAELLLNRGLVQDIGTYFRVKEGSPVKTMYEDVLDEANLIEKENNDLMQGIDCPVLATDNHETHIKRHTALTYDPEMRRNGQSLPVILNHIQQHRELMMQSAPAPQPPQGNPAGASPVPATPNAPAPEAAQPAQPAQAPVSL